MTKLTETQTIVLRAGAQRPENIALLLLKGLAVAAAKMAVTKMTERGWLQEVDANLRRSEPLWRETGDGHGTAGAVQPGHVVADPVAAGLEAAMVGVGGLEDRQGLGLGAVEVQGKLLGVAPLVVLEREEIIGPARQNGRGNLGLSAHGIDDDERAGQLQAFKQQWYGIDLVRLHICRLLPQPQPLACRRRPETM